jgi:osmoprotectant transport system substrate-binding protein
MKTQKTLQASGIGLVVILALLLSIVPIGAQTPTTPPPTAAATLPPPPPAPTLPAGTAITVGSKNFTEEFIIAELYAQMLEDAGATVTRKLNLGGTPVLQAALTSAQVDLYPEYTGTGLLTVLKLPVQSDAQKVYQTVADEYKKQFNLIWLDQAAMNDTQALAMPADKADKLGIKTLSDMAAKADQLVIIGTPEFEEREDGLPGVKKAYGDFQLKRFIPVDPGLRYEGLMKGDADVVVAFSTDWQIAANKLVLLQDDKGLWPPYHVAPVVRGPVLEAKPQIRDILNRLAPRLTTEATQVMNLEVGSKQRAPADVAKEFLIQQGLIKSK